MYLKAMNVTNKVMIANNNINAKTVDSYKNWIELINEPKAHPIFFKTHRYIGTSMYVPGNLI